VKDNSDETDNNLKTGENYIDGLCFRMSEF